MMLIIWPLLIYCGFKAQRFSLRVLLFILPAVIAGTAIYDWSAVRGAARFGEDQSARWQPAVFATDVAITASLWLAAYALGYIAAFVWQRKKGK
ncbi:MAG: hypothetical protein RLZZ08_967 [Pseudomonadota bacterium]